MRAIEIFQDLNHDDMDVSAPPSSREYHKEEELAMKLNNYLNQLIEDGFFDDCEARGKSTAQLSKSYSSFDSSSLRLTLITKMYRAIMMMMMMATKREEVT